MQNKKSGIVKASLVLLSGLFAIGTISLFLSKLVFYFTNSQLFDTPTLLNFIGGIRFDMAIVSLLMLLPTLLLLLPIPRVKALKFIILFFWFLGITAALCLNYIDVQYFRFTGKRMSIDLFFMAGLGKELPALVKAFLIDFWYLLILFGLQLFLMYTFSKALFAKHFKFPVFNWKTIIYNTISLPILLAVFIIVFRGIGLKPINTLTAMSYGTSEQAALVLNSPFTVIKSAESNHIEHTALIDDDLRNHLAPFVHVFHNDTLPIKKKNVVLLIVESLSEEYFHILDSNGQSFLPFLSELKEKSLRFDYSYASGKRSIDAVPALLASIPSWTSTPFITSAYNTNSFQSIPSVLKKHGYTSTFFHGGKNGTMGFDEFCIAAGVDSYFGLDEYPNQNDFDGTWGISDRPYLHYVAEKIKAETQPAFHTVFTLSSHHPFKVPAPYNTQLPRHTLEIMQSMAYADLSVKTFFETLKTWDKFDETLFIITGDHTSISDNNFWSQAPNNFKVPIWFYASDLDAKSVKASISHIDVLPTVADYLNLPDSIFSVGQSAFAHNHQSIQYLSNLFYLSQNDTVMSFSYPNFDEAQETFYVLDQQKKTIPKDSLSFNSDILKASVDQFYLRLTQNKLNQQ